MPRKGTFEKRKERQGKEQFLEATTEAALKRKRLKATPDAVESKKIKERTAVKEQLETDPPLDPMAQADTLMEIGGLDRIEREGHVLQMDWAIRFPLLKPQEYLVAERGYSIKQANSILHETGGEDDWVLRRVEIQNKVTETVVKRHVDQIAEFNETFIKASKVGLAKSLEMMTKLSLDAAKDEDGKLIIDPKTKKPVYRGFRSIDLLNTLSSVKLAQEIWRKAMGIKDEEGMAQILEKIDQMNQQQRIQVNQQINLTVNPAKKEAEQKLESFVREMSYEDIRAFVDYHKKKSDIIDAEYNQGNSGNATDNRKSE